MHWSVRDARLFFFTSGVWLQSQGEVQFTEQQVLYSREPRLINEVSVIL